MERIISYAVVEARIGGIYVVAVREGEKPAAAAALYDAELIEDFPNRWLAEMARAELTGRSLYYEV